MMQDQFDVQRTPERYLHAATLTRGARARLAATWGMQLSGVTDPSALALYSTNLGIALQICDDIAGLLEADPVSGRKPRHILREGHYTLPVLYAIQEDVTLADALARTDAIGLDDAVERIQVGNGTARASEECRRFVAQARTALATVPHDPQPLQAICELVTWRLASLTQRALDSAATRNGEIAPPRPIGRTTVSGI
jgi:heptaprenyl diphosphate synthase